MKKFSILLSVVMVVMSFISCKDLTGDENQKQKSPAGIEDQTNESPEMLYAKQYKEYLESIPKLETKGAVKWAGLRYSPYGIRKDEVSGSKTPKMTNEVWKKYVTTLTGAYEGSEGAIILIPGTISKGGCSFGFPEPKGVDTSSVDVDFDEDDLYEDFLTMCDSKNYKVWLQVESGYNDLVKLCEIVMTQYSDHPCVAGFGVDCEWYNPDTEEGCAVDDKTAEALVKKVREFNKDYTVFTKHWDERFMPPTYRDGMIFVNDSQIYESLEVMVSDFTNWARYFQGSPVFFQIGYKADVAIWQKDPLATAKAITDSASEYNKEIGLIWVDFTMRSALDRY